MEREVYMPEYPVETGRASAGIKAVAVVMTVVIGASLAGMAIYMWRAAPAPPPKVVERIVPQIEYRDREVPMPAPPPVVEKPPPAPPPKVEPFTPPWEGCWRIPGTAVPMIELKKGPKGEVSGRFAPSWGGLYVFRGGIYSPFEGRIEFAAGDQSYRVHIRMKLSLDDGSAKVEGWIDPSDWLTMMQTANRKRGIPQLLAARTELEAMSKKLGERISLGIFRLITVGTEASLAEVAPRTEAPRLLMPELPPLALAEPAPVLIPPQLPPRIMPVIPAQPRRIPNFKPPAVHRRGR